MKIYFVNDLHWDFWRKQNYTLEKFFDEFFLPADVCCIAGDIGNDYEHSVDLLKYLKSRYLKVVYVMGNHDLGIFKRDKYRFHLNHTFDKKYAFKNVCANQLDGTINKVYGVKFGGTCGSCDWSWVYNNFETSDEEFLYKWQNWFDCKWWRINCTSPWVIMKTEMDKMINVCNQDPKIFVTHFQPLSAPIADSYKNDKTTGLFVFDDSKLNLKPGTIYHYGHTHNKNKFEKNGILYLNNCIGYPGDLIDEFGVFNKEDFLIEVEGKI